MDVETCRFFPSGVVILTGGVDMRLKIWSAQDASCPRTLVGHTGGQSKIVVLRVCVCVALTKWKSTLLLCVCIKNSDFFTQLCVRRLIVSIIFVNCRYKRHCHH